MRFDSKLKGYTSGTPDILILNHHVQFKGLAIELKTPTGKGVFSDNQATFLDALHANGLETKNKKNIIRIRDSCIWIGLSRT